MPNFGILGVKALRDPDILKPVISPIIPDSSSVAGKGMATGRDELPTGFMGLLLFRWVGSIKDLWTYPFSRYDYIRMGVQPSLLNLKTLQLYHRQLAFSHLKNLEGLYARDFALINHNFLLSIAIPFLRAMTIPLQGQSNHSCFLVWCEHLSYRKVASHFWHPVSLIPSLNTIPLTYIIGNTIPSLNSHDPIASPKAMTL